MQIPRFPFLGFPYRYPYTYQNYKKSSSFPDEKEDDMKSISSSDEPLIEIMGIKLFLDDVLILCLIFLLYKEEVKDEMLFICLLLLLFS